MKRVFLIVSVLSLLFCSCEMSKPVRSVDYDCQTYNALTCNVPIHISMSKDATKLVLKAEEQLIDAFRFDNQGGNLTITIDNLNKHTWKERPLVTLPMPEHLTKVQCYSMIDLDADTTIETDQLDLVFSAAVNMSANVKIDTLSITTTCYGTDIRLSGVTEKVKITANSLQFNAINLISKEYDCELWNTTAAIGCTKTANLNTVNGSTLTIYGDCVINRNDKNIWNSNITQIK